MIIFSSLNTMMNSVYRSQRCLSHFKFPAISFHSFSPRISEPFCVPCDKVILKKFQCKQIKSTSSYLQKEDSSESKVRDRILTVPNVLSLSRIAATPVLSYYIINLDFKMSTGILVAASITDFVDGWIARSFKSQSSKLGSFLDPLADKMLVITLYGSMAYTHIIPDILMGLIVFRDVVLLSAGVYIRYLSIPSPRTLKKYFDHKHSSAQLSPTMLSKINTAIQLLTAIISLYGSATSNVPEQFLLFLWYVAGFTTITSGISYIFAKNTYKILKHEKK